MNKLKYLIPYIPWLIIIMIIELLTIMILWLAGISIFMALIKLVILVTLLLFFSISTYLIRLEIHKERALQAFLLNPNKSNEHALINSWGAAKKPMLKILANTIYQQQQQIEQANNIRLDYENYITIWVHEIKLPLSLLTLMLDNQQTNNMWFKLDYIRNQINNNISQMMFYHRIKSNNQDYFFEDISLEACLAEVIEDYMPLFNEKSFDLQLAQITESIFTDRRSLIFIISQILNNAIKYSQSHPTLAIFTSHTKKHIILHFKDNGQGVKACDIPHIFDKGFTGDSGDTRKTSTGLGLFLVKQLCEDLQITIEVITQWQQGFEIQLKFNK